MLDSASFTTARRCAVVVASGSTSDRSGVQLDIDHRVVAELLDDRGEPRHQGRPAQELRAQAEDEVPDVADREVEAVDRPLDASLDLVRVIRE